MGFIDTKRVYSGALKATYAHYSNQPFFGMLGFFVLAGGVHRCSKSPIGYVSLIFWPYFNVVILCTTHTYSGCEKHNADECVRR